MKTLLQKVGTINKLIQSPTGNQLSYSEMARVLCDNIESNCYIIGNKGEILGYAFMENFTCDPMDEIIFEQNRFPESYYNEVAQIYETKVNVRRPQNACVFTTNDSCIYHNKITTYVPITGGGRRLGTLVLAQFDVEFTEGDLVLAEYGATVVGMEIFRKMADKIEQEARQRAAVHIALEALSYTEQEAVEHIFDAFEGEEGVLVASKIADSANIARSVIVNSLRKIESAGVIEVRSLGMKGTYIRILNPFFKEEVNKMRR